MPAGLGRALVPGQDSPSLMYCWNFLDDNSLSILVSEIWLEQAMPAVHPPTELGRSLSSPIGPGSMARMGERVILLYPFPTDTEAERCRP